MTQSASFATMIWNATSSQRKGSDVGRPRYRFSGHESFPCRYAWLPKSVEALRENEQIFSQIDEAMVMLGLGKNMVQALRFWVQAMRVAEPNGGQGLRITEFGERIFGPEGFDPYIEEFATLWLLHWQLCSHDDNPLFAWDFLFNRFHEPEIVRSDVMAVIERESRQLARPLSKATLAQHFDVFLHTYVASRGRKSKIPEDSLDSPFIELELIQFVGQRVSRDGKQEPAYAFRRDPKPELSSGVFMFAIEDFWCRCRPNESTLSLRDIAHASGSPGQVFKLPEDDIRRRLARIERDSDGDFSYSESAMVEQLIRDTDYELDTLAVAYDGELVDA